ncbi:hypothetical protein GLYMA_17G036000v4 [Glycine max]|uniref:Uncharacterized protein n=1 Tax=Glycine max TaxID=3847 RepID=K7MJT0_SOYBN|nr:hypothetical protein GYH30_046141 [Glycine max]KRH02393.1 hypothetical protein GLYMA_17G036000v4 [Glycine max]
MVLYPMCFSPKIFFSCLANVFHHYYEIECVGQFIPCMYIIGQLVNGWWGELNCLSGVACSYLLSNCLLHALVEIQSWRRFCF